MTIIELFIVVVALLLIWFVASLFGKVVAFWVGVVAAAFFGLITILMLIGTFRELWRLRRPRMINYAKALGQLIVNLHSLEFMIRAYLYHRVDGKHTPLAAGQTLSSVKVGDKLPVNAVTDYSTLGQLIDRYNKLVGATDPSLCIDSSIVPVRDALAHGRVSSDDPTQAPQLLKFDRPSGNPETACVTYCQTLNSEWFKSQTKLVGEQIGKVAKVFGATVSPDS